MNLKRLEDMDEILQQESNVSAKNSWQQYTQARMYRAKITAAV